MLKHSLARTRPRSSTSTVRTVAVEVKLPAEGVRSLHGKAAVARRLRDSFVLELLRDHVISQGRASELLHIDRFALVERMNAADIPVFDYEAKEFSAGLVVARRLAAHSKA